MLCMFLTVHTFILLSFVFIYNKAIPAFRIKIYFPRLIL